MKLIIPASTANLGCGYDSLALALALYNTFTFEAADEDAVIGWRSDVREHMVISSLHTAQEILGFPSTKALLAVDAGVPVKRGLGSSATCITAGCLMAFLLEGKPIDQEAVLHIANRIEGHPDNIAPMIVGGLTAAMQKDGEVSMHKFPIDPRLRAIAVIPPFPFSTAVARGAIPARVPHADAVFNLSRVALLIAALGEGDLSRLSVYLEDALHEPYRLPKIAEKDANYPRAMEMLGSICEGACLSGAGPTMLGLTARVEAKKEMEEWLAQENIPYEVRLLNVDHEGYRVEAEAE